MMKQEKNGILILPTCICGINYINNEYYQNNSLRPIYEMCKSNAIAALLNLNI